MAKPNEITFASTERMAILYEDRSVLAVDKPRGWMLAPSSWLNTRRNLQVALECSIRAGDFWARSRQLKYLRFVHRLDADTTGVLVLAKSPGALASMSSLFESRRVEKRYWAVVEGEPAPAEWTCRMRIAPDPKAASRMKLDEARGKPAETRFRVLEVRNRLALVEAQPLTGRTHQLRLHLAAAGHSVLGDELYGPTEGRRWPLALRAVRLDYTDPFRHRRVQIRAPVEEFLREYRFELSLRLRSASGLKG